MSTFEDDQNGEAQVHQKQDLQSRLNSLLEGFCPNLNCIQAACTMHGGYSGRSLAGLTDITAKADAHIYPDVRYINRSMHQTPFKSTVTNQDMRDSEGIPCGDECFRNNNEFAVRVSPYSYLSLACVCLLYFGPQGYIQWDDADLTTLKTILNITPDLYPCELAVLCRKPCREV
jgi:hypothetical protein